MARPGVRTPPRYPAVLTNYLRGQLQRQAREGGARLTMVDTVHAVVLPDDRLHLGRGLARCHPQVVVRNIDDGRAQHLIGRGRLPVRLLKGQQVNRYARWRLYIGCRSGNEGEARYRSARAEAYERSHLLPPWFAKGLHKLTSFLAM